jgi:phosphate butyryltransferase
VTVTEKDERHGNLTLACRCTNQAARGDLGEAEVKAPTEKVSRPRVARCAAAAHGAYHRDRGCAYRPPLPTHRGAPLLARRGGSGGGGGGGRADRPHLIGPPAKIPPPREAGVDITLRLVPTAHSHAAAAEAVAMVRAARRIC